MSVLRCLLQLLFVHIRTCMIFRQSDCSMQLSCFIHSIPEQNCQPSFVSKPLNRAKNLMERDRKVVEAHDIVSTSDGAIQNELGNDFNSIDELNSDINSVDRVGTNYFIY